MAGLDLRVDRTVLVRGVVALGGVAVLGLGTALLRTGQVGVDPYTAANMGISGGLGLSLGLYQLISNAVLFIPLLIWGRQYIGLGTIINMVLTGFFIDLFAGPLAAWLPSDPSTLVQGVLFVLGILVFTFGASAYMSAGIGTAPYDAIAPIIVDRTRARYRLVRTVQDLAFVGLAVLVSGPVGVGTVMTAFFAGPLIDFFNDRVNEPLVERIAHRG